VLVPKYNADDLDGFPDPIPATPAEKMTNRLSKFLVSLSMKPMRDPILYLSDAELLELPAIPHARAGGGILGAGNDKQKTVNPEQDSFAYMEVILESLAVLGKLGHALEVVSARIGSELNALIETTIDEVAER
jgi:exocyst complex component 4